MEESIESRHIYNHYISLKRFAYVCCLKVAITASFYLFFFFLFIIKYATIIYKGDMSSIIIIITTLKKIASNAFLAAFRTSSTFSRHQLILTSPNFKKLKCQ